MVLHCHYLNYPVHPLQSSMQQMSIVYFYNHKHYLSAIFTACLDKEQLLDGRLPFCHGPAHVAQWSKHSGTTCSRVWSAQWLGFKPQPWHVRLLKNYCLSNAFIAFERLSNHFGVCACVCVSVSRSVVERLRPQFFTDFHQILHVARKSGRIDAYCLWDKPEVDFRF